ncbi:MAG: hypothetical protein WB511_07825 [Nitrososphaeraceae archaeon]
MISRKLYRTAPGPKLSFIKIFVIILLFAILVNTSYVLPSEGLTRYYNCVARVANKNATLTISNVDNCYNKIFKGALNYYGIKQQLIGVNSSTVFHQSHEKYTHSAASEYDSNIFHQKTKSVDTNVFG